MTKFPVKITPKPRSAQSATSAHFRFVCDPFRNFRVKKARVMVGYRFSNLRTQ